MRKAKLILIPIFFLFSILLIPNILAIGEITQDADRLNYWDAFNHTVTVENNGSLTTNITIVIPAGWNWTSGSTCANITTSLIQCILGTGASGTYTVESPGSSDAEYEVTDFNLSANNSYTGNNVSFIRIQEHEIFHTLVEFGRGGGNYFYDTLGDGLAGSGHTGTGCTYLPNETMFELNYLHKVLNIKQYFGLATSEASQVSFTCTYPNNTVVREHLVTGMQRGTLWEVNYSISSVEGSWERMGYLGQDFDSGENTVGDTIDVNCTDMTYFLEDAGGWVKVDEDAFSLEIRDREPFTVSATTNNVIGNGSQEVPITYNITNMEEYCAKDVKIDINAPEYSEFIGVRGELWGVGRDQYLYEKLELCENESTVITLVARFNTSEAGAMSSLPLARGVGIQYITCWEANAYNPGEYLQSLLANGIGNGTVNMSSTTSIINIINIIVNINTTVTEINTTINLINTTVNAINQTINLVNTTITEINTTINQVNGTVNLINGTVTTINGTVTNIYNDTQYIIDLLNCNGSIDTPVCNISINLDDILNFTNITYQKIIEMDEFNDEIIFLVTDAFSLEQNAKKSLSEGNILGAREGLMQANDKLTKALTELEKSKAEQTETLFKTGATSKESSDLAFSGWPTILLLLLVMAGIVVYLLKPVETN